jgi:hypothetical protein
VARRAGSDGLRTAERFRDRKVVHFRAAHGITPAVETLRASRLPHTWEARRAGDGRVTHTYKP